MDKETKEEVDELLKNPSKIEEDLESVKMRKFIDEYQELVIKHGYDFELPQISPARIVKVNFPPGVKEQMEENKKKGL